MESTGGSKTHQSPCPKEHSQKPPRKDEELSKPSSRTSGTSLPRAPTPQAPASPCVSQRSHLPRNERTSTTRRSIHLRQRSRKTNATTRTATSPTSPWLSHSKKDHKHSSDKDSNSCTSHVSHKCYPSPHSSSLKHSSKKTCIDSSTCSVSESSQARCLNSTRSMSDYDDSLHFAMPRNASTPHKSGHELHNHSTSTWAPLDCNIYNNFCYRGHVGFGRGGVTPGSTAGSAHVQQHVAARAAVFFLAVPQAPSYLTPQQSAKVFHLGAECQAMGTQLAKEFQQLSGLEAMHHATAQATTHETINRGCVERGIAYNILMSTNAPNKKWEKTLQKLQREANQAWKDTNDVVFKHQLRYDSQLVSFITSAERMLQAKQDEVWACMQSLVDSSGMPQDIASTLLFKYWSCSP